MTTSPLHRIGIVAPWDPAPFCSHCGERPRAERDTRVCERCELGIILQAPVDLAPKVGDAFLVLDRALTISAVSASAEELLAIGERDAIYKHVGQLLVPADTQEPEDSFVAHVYNAAAGAPDVGRIIVRPAQEFGVRFWARIVPCGPRPGAVVILDAER